jgi:5-carboxymethyl-2-hydroxymuconate isomerase
MPHIILEYSENIIEQGEFSELFQTLHLLLTELLPTQLNSCKSRALKCTSFFLGDGYHQNAFVHVTIKVLPGREKSHLDSVAQKILPQLERFFSESLSHLNIQISLEIKDLSTNYFKIPKK